MTGSKVNLEFDILGKYLIHSREIGIGIAEIVQKVTEGFAGLAAHSGRNRKPERIEGGE